MKLNLEIVLDSGCFFMSLKARHSTVKMRVGSRPWLSSR
jgi:hypothetical protein